ncbi:amino acid ABC transporter permease [Microcella alkalica]|uniref:Glutamate transport system permease protein n=1 Tax=Microcella alkalica TaxID=355930 RepID=A0A839E5L0_9MICO|nr:amino acid ABC transporter permease [Microcella sp.]MBA8847661.1 glutamate transport system permease protein [Microcella alkalica]MDO8338483.1 amino acid ABC transporter permease [Microcella sp.]
MQFLIESGDVLLEGFLATLRMLALTVLLALPLGVVLAAMRISPVPSLRWVATGFTELLRNTPLTLVFFLLVFVVPRLGVVVDFQISAVIALTLYTAPFYAEAIRSGVNSVPVGQAEAARSVGLTFSQTARFVIIPQALRSVVPPLINVTIALTKNTSVAGGFLVFELFASSRRLANSYADETIAIFLAVAACYLLVTIPLGRIADRLEKKVAVMR